MQTILISLYLVSIITANLLVAHFGPQIAIINAFFLIGLDLTARDLLHEKWQHKYLWQKMLGLITAGSLLSYLLNQDAGPIALASFAAFATAGLADTIIYQLLGARARLLKINGSNVVSAAVDSVVFPALAFGFPLLWPIMLGQFVAKVAGGGVWSLVLVQLRWSKEQAGG
jgi:queuosine precursor transporter